MVDIANYSQLQSPDPRPINEAIPWLVCTLGGAFKFYDHTARYSVTGVVLGVVRTIASRGSLIELTETEEVESKWTIQ